MRVKSGGTLQSLGAERPGAATGPGDGTEPGSETAIVMLPPTLLEEESMSFFRANQAVVLEPGEGRHLDVVGDLITLLVSGKETNGAFTVLSETSPPGGGTPLHTHHKEDEALYVLKGEYEIQCGDQTVRARPGSFVFAPREIPHKLTNVSSGPSTVLGIVSPAGFEGFWEEVSQLPLPPNMDAVLAIAKKYQLEIHAP